MTFKNVYPLSDRQKVNFSLLSMICILNIRPRLIRKRAFTEDLLAEKLQRIVLAVRVCGGYILRARPYQAISGNIGKAENIRGNIAVIGIHFYDRRIL